MSDSPHSQTPASPARLPAVQPDAARPVVALSTLVNPPAPDAPAVEPVRPELIRANASIRDDPLKRQAWLRRARTIYAGKLPCLEFIPEEPQWFYWRQSPNGARKQWVAHGVNTIERVRLDDGFRVSIYSYEGSEVLARHDGSARTVCAAYREACRKQRLARHDVATLLRERQRDHVALLEVLSALMTVMQDANALVEQLRLFEAANPSHLDHLTLAYLRAGLPRMTITAVQRDAWQLVLDLCKPFHQRSTTWIKLMRLVPEGVGSTPCSEADARKVAVATRAAHGKAVS